MRKAAVHTWVSFGVLTLSVLAFGESHSCSLDAQFVAVEKRGGSNDASDGAAQLPTLVVRNTSKLAVIGLVVNVDFIDPQTGKSVSNQIVSALRQTAEGESLPLPPGDSVTLRRTTALTLTGGRLADHKVTFDLVLYADGTHCGPALLRQSAELLARTHAK